VKPWAQAGDDLLPAFGPPSPWNNWLVTAEVPERWLPALASPWPGWVITKLNLTDFYLRAAAKMVHAIEWPPDWPLIGCDFRVYRFNPPGTPNGRPLAFASSENPGHKARDAFDGSTSFWEAAATGRGANGQYVGYDFGDRSARPVRQVRVQWTDAERTPEAIAVEYSDDGNAWVAVDRFLVVPLGAASYRMDSFRFESGDAHRFWRIVAQLVPPGHGFAVAELYFDRKPSTEPAAPRQR
jgi:F5/8 type C domain